MITNQNICIYITDVNKSCHEYMKIIREINILYNTKIYNHITGIFWNELGIFLSFNIISL